MNEIILGLEKNTSMDQEKIQTLIFRIETLKEKLIAFEDAPLLFKKVLFGIEPNKEELKYTCLDCYLN